MKGDYSLSESSCSLVAIMWKRRWYSGSTLYDISSLSAEDNWFQAVESVYYKIKLRCCICYIKIKLNITITTCVASAGAISNLIAF